MSEVLLATCTALPEGEWGAPVLDRALEAEGVSARWAVWDDPSVDWSGALVALRSTWDYEERLPEFLAWTRSLPRVLNSAAIFAWNTDKAYLVELDQAGVPVVPTLPVDAAADLAGAAAGFGDAVVKPRTGAGGRGVLVVRAGQQVPEPGRGPWVVQPLVEAVRDEGELSVFVVDGEVVDRQFQKVPAQGEIRVHHQYGGSTIAVPLDPEAADVARRTVAAAEGLLGERLDYARVDQMRLADGRLAVSELEVTEPGLYLDVDTALAEPFAHMVWARVANPRGRAGSR